MQLYTGFIKIGHIFENSPPVLTKLHNISHKLRGGKNIGFYHRLLRRSDKRRIGIIGRIIYINSAAVGKIYLINNRRSGSNKVKIIFSFKPFLNYLHMKQSKKAAAEAETESN